MDSAQPVSAEDRPPERLGEARFPVSLRISPCRPAGPDRAGGLLREKGVRNGGFPAGFPNVQPGRGDGRIQRAGARGEDAAGELADIREGERMRERGWRT